jgi:hypothetical protein
MRILEAPFNVKLVWNWERLLGANIIAQSRAWYTDQYNDLDQQRDAMRCIDACSETFVTAELCASPESKQKVLTWEISSIRGDATNVPVCGSKAHVCEVISSFRHVRYRGQESGQEAVRVDADDVDPSGGLVVGAFYETSKLHRVYAEIAKVPASCTGVESRALFLKQMGEVGVESWLQTEPHNTMMAITTPFDIHVHLKAVLFCTDKGGDQQTADSFVEVDTMTQLTTFYIREWCRCLSRLHCLHLTSSVLRVFLKCLGRCPAPAPCFPIVHQFYKTKQEK